MNCKFALIFLVVLAVALKSSQGTSISIQDIKEDVAELKKPLIAAKVGIATGLAAKIKFAALKKAAVVKTIVKAPFILAKKAALLKIKAIKSLAAFKADKAKKAVSFVAGIPSAALAKLKPNSTPHVQVAHQTEVIDNIYPAYPDHGQNYNHHQEQHQQYQIPANTNYHYYKSALDAPRTYTNDYSLVPENNSGSQYYPVSDIIQPHQNYGVPAN
ncbi:uncharacterized protein LOC129952457 [Eupeodes corollae]|uniref:uncharacterized protein LOC129952457 n=1 Tax=Eupeodes corollae TaxID=290404 RepID=UPI002492B959|nr:uncharacterized protein LOC129952457 [Eupeodes corollae]